MCLFSSLSSSGVLFLLFLAVVTAIALEDGGDSRREMTTDWSGTTETSVTTDGHQLIVSRSEEEMAEDGRSGRAAEIQATNLNLGNPSESPSTTTTTTTTTPVPISSSTATDEPDFSLDGHETSTSGPTLTESSTESLSFTSPSTTDAITTSTETVIVNSSTTTLKEEEEEEEEIRHIATTPTPAKETSTASNMNGDEYVADDHGPSLTTDNEGLLDSSAEASVVNHKHTEPSTATQVVQRTTTVGEETATATISTTTTEATTTPAATIKPSLNHLMTAAAAVGRSLAQEENVAWPESKSTKVIGTIIEDIHSPSSSSSTAESITNGSIVAIALCTVCLIVSSLGESYHNCYTIIAWRIYLFLPFENDNRCQRLLVVQTALPHQPTGNVERPIRTQRNGR